MGVPLFALLAAAAIVFFPAASQNKKPAWTAPLTLDGQPDLQGNWLNISATPLERPKELEGRETLTDAEVAELKKRAERLFRHGYSDFPAGDDFFLAALRNVDRYTRATSTADSEFVQREFDNRTSLIVNPSNGRLPAYTEEGRIRRDALAAALLRETPATGWEDLTTAERCITWGVPMPRPSPYTSHYQIVQSPGYVVLFLEAIHDARIIPLDGRPHLPRDVRTWNGDSRGRWEGQTLVVDTTNFSSKTNFMGAAENLHLVERLTRVAADEIRYEIGVDDPTTWTGPWTAVLRLKRTEEKIYEFACHEGNGTVMEGVLRAGWGDGAK